MVSPVREGGLVADKYRVERVIGVGGMGVVVAAQHVELDERVALKLLKEEAAKKPELVERFLREARAATRIKSEHVVRVMDVGRLEDGLPRPRPGQAPRSGWSGEEQSQGAPLPSHCDLGFRGLVARDYPHRLCDGPCGRSGLALPLG